MSQSISSWIAAYLVGVAEQYGADMMSIPRFNKKKKGQLVEFLTYGEDDVIWGRISDKEYLVPIRFSRDAVQEYNKLNTTRITQYKTAIISIKDFKPFFARIPLGKKMMTNESFLAVECHSFSVIGSYGEAMFGNPKPIEKNHDLREWSDGLRNHGGAGNCLKNRKKATEEYAKAAELPDPIPPRQQMTTVPLDQLTKKTVTAVESDSRSTKLRDRPWAITKNLLLRKPPPEIARLHAALKVDGDPETETSKAEQVQAEPYILPHKRRRISKAPESPPRISDSLPRSRSATPISEREWPPSHPVHRSSPHPSLVSISPIHLAKSMRMSIVPQSEPPSSVHAEEPTEQPFSSSLPSQVLIAEETKLLAPLPHMCIRREISRKVSPPRQPSPVSHSQGETIILVPNSDTSLSYSQSLSQLKSQPQTQFRSQPLNSSPPVILSQLAYLSKTQKPPGSQHRQSSVDGALESLEDCHTPSLFSDHPSQGYDGDRSSPNVSLFNRKIGDAGDNDNEYLQRHSSHDTVLRKVLSSEFHQGEKEIKEPSGASLIVNVPESQSLILNPYGGDIPTDRNEKSEEHDAGDEVSTRGKLAFDISQGLDDDDTQTHASLFGSSLRSQISQIQQPSPPSSGIIPFQILRRSPDTEVLDKPTVTSQYKLDKQSSGLITTESPNQDRSNVITESIAGGAQHDPQAWKEPSFLRSRPSKVGPRSKAMASGQLTRSKDIGPIFPFRPESASQTLKPSRLINEAREQVTAEVSHRKRARLSSLPTTSNHVLSSSSGRHHNADPSRRSTGASPAPQQPTRQNDSSATRQDLATEACTRPGPRLQGNKRGQTSTLDDEEANGGPAHQHAKKKRKVVVPQHPEQGDDRDREQQQLCKLNGFTVDLDRIKLDDVKYPVVTWDRVWEIICATDKDRS